MASLPPPIALTFQANLMNYQPVRPTNLPPAGLTKPGYVLKLPPARPTDPPPPTQINPPLPRQVNSLPRRPTNPPPARLASHLKQVFSCDSDEEALDDNNVTKKKRRQKGKKQPKAKASRMTYSSEEGEYFVLDGQHDDADDAEEAHDDGIKDHQLGFYQGELKRLVARSYRLHASIFTEHGGLSPKRRSYQMGGEVILSFLPGCLWNKLQRFVMYFLLQKYLFYVVACRSNANVHGWNEHFGALFLWT